jgi:hypothetical protein
MFARHWLAALMRERRPHLYARLPRSFSSGEPLPNCNGVLRIQFSD